MRCRKAFRRLGEQAVQEMKNEKNVNSECACVVTGRL